MRRSARCFSSASAGGGPPGLGTASHGRPGPEDRRADRVAPPGRRAAFSPGAVREPRPGSSADPSAGAWALRSCRSSGSGSGGSAGSAASSAGSGAPAGRVSGEQGGGVDVGGEQRLDRGRVLDRREGVAAEPRGEPGEVEEDRREGGERGGVAATRRHPAVLRQHRAGLLELGPADRHDPGVDPRLVDRPVVDRGPDLGQDPRAEEPAPGRGEDRPRFRDGQLVGVGAGEQQDLFRPGLALPAPQLLARHDRPERRPRDRVTGLARGPAAEEPQPSVLLDHPPEDTHGDEHRRRFGHRHGALQLVKVDGPSPSARSGRVDDPAPRVSYPARDPRSRRRDARISQWDRQRNRNRNRTGKRAGTGAGRGGKEREEAKRTGPGREQGRDNGPSEVGCLGDLADDGPADPAAAVEFAEKHQVVEVFERPEPRRGAGAERPLAVGVGLHVMGDQRGRPVGDRPFEHLQGGGHVVGRVDRLADVVQERRQEELLVIGAFVPRQLEDLKAVVKRLALGMILRALLHSFQRLEQHPVHLEPIDVLLHRLDLLIEVVVGRFFAEERLQLGDRGPLDRLAGDRTLEDVMGLVRRVDGQLDGVSVVDVDVREDPLLAVLDDPLQLDLVGQAVLVEGGGHERDAVAEDVEVDVRAVADVAGPDAADESGSEPGELPHHPERLDAHVAEPGPAFRPLVHAGEGLDLVADLAVGGQVGGPVPVLDAELARGLALGGEVLGLGPLVHELGGEEGDLPPDAVVGHGGGAPLHAHQGGAGPDLPLNPTTDRFERQ